MKSDLELIHGLHGLNPDVPQPWLETALAITGAFEGTGYTNVAGDFDGMGISAGILQWNYGQGSLQKKILMPYIEAMGEGKLNKYFPAPISKTASMTPGEAVKFARKTMLNGKTVKPEWVDAWKNFLELSVMKDIQLQAAGSIAAQAYEDAISHNLISKRAFCWFFDVRVQNGSLKGINKPGLTMSQKVDVWFKSVIGKAPTQGLVVIPFPVMTEYEKNVAYANIPEKLRDLWQANSLSYDEEGIILLNWILLRVVKNQWESDVISRKGTIAHKIGYVHGRKYDLREMI